MERRRRSTLARAARRRLRRGDLERTAAQVDAEPQPGAGLSAVADSGPLFRLGAIEVDGIERYDADAVRRLAPFNPGDRYTEKQLLDYQERLVKAGLFEGASVEIDPDPAHADSTPVGSRSRS